MGHLDTLARDARHAARALRRAPGFTSLAVLVIALGIGANTAIFSLVSAVLLKPLPFVEPDRLVFLWDDASAVGGSARSVISLATYVDWRERSRSFEGIAAFGSTSYSLTGVGEPERLQALRTTPNLLSILGVQALVGRTFGPAEVAEATPVVVVSQSLWTRRFGADPNVVGREVVLDGSKYTVIGVVPPSFRFPADVDVFMPTAFTPQELADRGVWTSYAVARLKTGVTLAQAQAEMTAIATTLNTEGSLLRGHGVTVAPLQEQLAIQTRPTLFTLLGAVGVLLLIACANVANLLLARGASRQRELALRRALGADNAHVVRQLLTESGVLAVGGVALGLLLAVASFAYLARLVPASFPGGTAPSIDWRVLAFTGVIALATVLLFGAGPALVTARSSVNAALNKGGGRSGVARGNRLRHTLVVAEVALTVVLLAAAGLLLRSYAAVLKNDPGFTPNNLLVAATVLPSLKYADFPRRQAFYDGVLAEVKALPGVKSAGYASFAPLTIRGGFALAMPEGAPQFTPETMQRYVVSDRVVTPGYLETLGVRLVAGRHFDERDMADAAPSAAVINETMATRFWPDGDAVGKRFRVGGDPNAPWWTVIGVAGDMRQMGLDVPAQPELYMPATRAVPSSDFFWPRHLLVRTATEPRALETALRDAIWRVDADQPVSLVTTMNEVFDKELANRNTQLTLVGAFAALALLLAAVGLYGVLSYAVAQRTSEIGLKMALGAQRSSVVRAVVLGALALACVGLAVGVAGALALTRLLQSFLFGVNATDPLTFVAAAVLLLLVTGAAAYLPARRAANVDPMTALRTE